MPYNICETCLLFPIDLTRSECASWVQALGSIAAILIAIAVFRLQQLSEAKRKNESDRQSNRIQLNVLRGIFLNIASLCARLSKDVGSEHAAWRLKVQSVDSARKSLEDLSLLNIHDGAIVTRVMDIIQDLIVVKSFLLALENPRSDDIKNKISSYVNKTSLNALTGVTEVSKLLVNFCNSEELELDMKLLEQREINSKLTLETLNEATAKEPQ